MLREMELYGQEYGSREPIDTIYFGGGTPSLLHLDDLERLMGGLREHFDISQVKEITFELNPEDVGADYLIGLKGLGVNRLSIGVQSFFDSDLKFMNRAHNAEQARDVVSMARRAGLDNFSLDLIFGLPHQPAEYWKANLEIATDMDVPHISSYSLTVEQGTPLAKNIARGIVEPEDEDVHAERFEFAMEYLMTRGYEHYEISSFALPGYRALHNHRYWDHANYIGLGPSAHSFWWKGLPAHRWSNVRNIRTWEGLLQQNTPPLEQREALALDDLADEHIMLRLRTADGLDLDELEDRYGVDLLLDRIDELAELETSGFIQPIRNRKIRLTNLGKTVCDAVTGQLLPSSRV